MTRNEMIELARRAGWDYANNQNGYDPLWKFGELVVIAEREACAKVCEEQADGAYWEGADVCATLIRARGQE